MICVSPPGVVRVSVPEDHHVHLPCTGSDGSDVVWTHEHRRVPVTRQGDHDISEDPPRYLLLPDGSLRLLRLDESDGGEYRCNRQLVAELQVLSGRVGGGGAMSGASWECGTVCAEGEDMSYFVPETG